jgi:hypothetical protein
MCKIRVFFSFLYSSISGTRADILHSLSVATQYDVKLEWIGYRMENFEKFMSSLEKCFRFSVCKLFIFIQCGSNTLNFNIYTLFLQVICVLKVLFVGVG